MTLILQPHLAVTAGLSIPYNSLFAFWFFTRRSKFLIRFSGAYTSGNICTWLISISNTLMWLFVNSSSCYFRSNPAVYSSAFTRSFSIYMVCKEVYKVQDLLRVNARTRCGLNALVLLCWELKRWAYGTPASYRCSLSLWIIRTNGRLLGRRRGPLGLCGVPRPRPRPRPGIKWYGKKADFSTTLLKNLTGGTSRF